MVLILAVSALQCITLLEKVSYSRIHHNSRYYNYYHYSASSGNNSDDWCFQRQVELQLIVITTTTTSLILLLPAFTFRFRLRFSRMVDECKITGGTHCIDWRERQVKEQ